MNIEEIKSLKITGKVFEIRAGRALTIIESCPNGRPGGRDLTFRNEGELDDLISALISTRKWLDETYKKEKTDGNDVAGQSDKV